MRPRVDPSTLVSHARELRDTRAERHRAWTAKSTAEARLTALEAECRRLTRVDGQRVKALRSTLRLLEIANEGKVVAERSAREHKGAARKLAARARVAADAAAAARDGYASHGPEGGASAGAPTPRARDLAARCASLEDALRRKESRERVLERALAAAADGDLAVRLAEETVKTRRLALELDAALGELRGARVDGFALQGKLDETRRVIASVHGDGGASARDPPPPPSPGAAVARAGAGAGRRRIDDGGDAPGRKVAAPRRSPPPPRRTPPPPEPAGRVARALRTPSSLNSSPRAGHFPGRGGRAPPGCVDLERDDESDDRNDNDDDGDDSEFGNVAFGRSRDLAASGPALSLEELAGLAV